MLTGHITRGKPQHVAVLSYSCVAVWFGVEIPPIDKWEKQRRLAEPVGATWTADNNFSNSMEAQFRNADTMAVHHKSADDFIFKPSPQTCF